MIEGFCMKCGVKWHGETGKDPCAAGGTCDIRVSREIKAELRAIAGWLHDGQQRFLDCPWQHVGPRMGECLQKQQEQSPCAPCPACQFIRDSLKMLALP